MFFYFIILQLKTAYLFINYLDQLCLNTQYLTSEYWFWTHEQFLSLIRSHSWFNTWVMMEYWDSKITFLNFFELSDSQQMYDKFQLYLLQSCAYKVDKFWGWILVSLKKRYRTAPISMHLMEITLLLLLKVRIPLNIPKLVMLC